MNRVVRDSLGVKLNVVSVNPCPDIKYAKRITTLLMVDSIKSYTDGTERTRNSSLSNRLSRRCIVSLQGSGREDQTPDRQQQRAMVEHFHAALSYCSL